jgi:2-oxoisovalerate dehydrogenase E1 component alpha subunit
MSDQLN